MPSSTFSSSGGEAEVERPLAKSSLAPARVESIDARDRALPAAPAKRPARWISLLLLAIFFFLAAVELAAWYGFQRASKLQKRVREEYLAALAMRPTRALGHPQVLFVGNSLLIAGVDLPRLEAAVEPALKVQRFAVEGTAYFDWYYGLNRLFHEGARPDVVVLSLTGRQLANSEVIGEYFAHFLMRTRDLVPVARDLHLSLTGASNLLFGNLSAFYGARAEIRNWVLNRTLPGLGELMEVLTRGRPAPLTPAQLSLLPARLAALKRLAEENGACFVLLSPPTTTSEDYTAAIKIAAAAAGVPVLAPVEPGTLAREDFLADGFHLSESGAAKHTAALAPALRTAIENLYGNGRDN